MMSPADNLLARAANSAEIWVIHLGTFVVENQKVN